MVDHSPMPPLVPPAAAPGPSHPRAALAFGAALGCAIVTLALMALVTLGWDPLERLDAWLVTSAVTWTEARPDLGAWLGQIGVTSGKRLLWPLSAVVAALLWLFGRRLDGALMAGAIASTTVVTGAIKRTTSRERPEWYVPEDPLPTASFPSGHVSLWVAFVCALLLMLPLLGRPGRSPSQVARLASVPLLLLLAVISAQRVLQGRHFPSDVVAGVLVGAGCALACWAALAVLTRHSAAATAPAPSDRAEV